MIQSPIKRVAYFAAFIVPALFFYGIFFLFPFVSGIGISFTNWDGLTPRSPISMPIHEFEEKILSKITDASDREFILNIYKPNPDEKTYARLSLSGLARFRVDGIMGTIGYEPQAFRNIGLRNYIDIFTGKLNQQFYPRSYEKTNYNANSDLPAAIKAAEYEKNFFAKLRADDRALASRFYAKSGDQYVLSHSYDEFTIEDRIWQIPEVVSATVPSTAVDTVVASVKDAGLARDSAMLKTAVELFVSENKLSSGSITTVHDAADVIYSLGTFKKLLMDTWVEKKIDLGVAGFTVFFTIMTVIGANLLAFFIALALDTKIRSRNVLRSMFFIPNVLSMIVVALIWSFVFNKLLPLVTGISLWMGDPDKSAWLIVFVAIWQGAGYYMVIYLAGLQNVPIEIIEAARIDGAGKGQQLRLITLPLLIPAFTVCIFLSTANALKCFDLVYALAGPSAYAYGTVPFVLDIFFDAFARKTAGLATAKATILFLIIFAVTGIQLLVLKRKEVRM
jgi:ABC-type sugar transport system permease subunit